MEVYTPLVSIIIPVYNGSNYLKNAIDSAVGQTYPNIEIIIVNDGSNDNGMTRKVALSYGESVKYFEKENGGCASALNYGIMQMHGDWFSWLSHDDTYYPQKIEKSIDVIRANCLQNEKYLIYCASDLIDDCGKKIFHPAAKNIGKLMPIEFFYFLLFDHSVNGCALIIRKETLQEVGQFDEGLKYTLDFDYWLRASINGYGLFSFRECLCSNRVHREQVSVIYKDRLKPDIKKQLVKMGKIILNTNIDCEYNKALWLYTYSRNYYDEFKIFNSILEKKHTKRINLIFRVIMIRVMYILSTSVKFIYKVTFKRGMN